MYHHSVTLIKSALNNFGSEMRRDVSTLFYTLIERNLQSLRPSTVWLQDLKNEILYRNREKMDLYKQKQTFMILRICTLQDMTGKLTEVGRRYRIKMNVVKTKEISIVHDWIMQNISAIGCNLCMRN